MSTLRNLILTGLALLCLSVLLVSLLLFTSVGNQLIWRLATEQLPQLKGQLVAGQLAEGWQFEDLSWQDEAVQFSAEQLSLRWRPGGLLFGSLQVDALVGEGVSLTLAPAASAATESGEPQTASSAPLVLPFNLHLNQLALKKVHFAMPALTVELEHFASSANWLGSHLYIGTSQLSGLAVDWAMPATSAAQATDAPEPAAEPVKASSATAPISHPPPQAERMSLPPVTLPLDISLAGLRLERVRYRQPGLDTDWLNGQLAAEFIGDQLRLPQLSLEHPLGVLELKGALRFAEEYPLSLALGVQTAYGLPEGMPARRLDLTAEGSLGAMVLDAKLAGSEGLALAGRLDVLDPQLPFDLTLHWARLGWPLSGTPDYLASDGRLQAKGSLTHYEASLSSTVKALTYPQGRLTSQLQGNLHGLQLTRLTWDSDQTQAAISGTLAWQAGLDWQGALSLKSRRLQAWLPAVQGELALGLHSQFKLSDGHWQLALDKLAGQGRLNGYPVAVSGALSGNDRLQWQVKELRLTSGANRVRIHGQLDKQWALTGDLQAPELGMLGSGFEGGLSGRLALSGSASAPNIAVRLASARLRWPDGSLRELELDARLEPARQYAGELALSLGRLQLAGLGIKQVRLNANGNAKAHLLTLDFDGKTLAGSLQLEGALGAKGWQGTLQQTWFDTPVGRWQLAAPLSLASRAPWQRWQLGEQCWLSDPASLCLSAAAVSAHEGKLALRLDKFATERLAVLMPERLGWRSDLSGEAQLAWRNGVPTLTARLQTGAGEIISDGAP